MAKNDRVSEETFGPTVTAPKMTGGKIALFGHTDQRWAADSDRGTSVNVKTGYPGQSRN
jgi:hypothetical protein